MIDTDCIRRAQQGDREALAILYDCHYASIFSYIFYRVGDQHQAEDLAADVFVRMLSKLHQFVPGQQPLLPWLYTIARNLLIDHYRNHHRHQTVSLDDDLTIDPVTNPVKIVEMGLSCDQVRTAMQCLTDEQRQVVLLKFIEDRETTEIAELLGKNERAVRSLQHRALAALQRVLVTEGQ